MFLLVPAHPGSHRQRAVNGFVVVVVLCQSVQTDIQPHIQRANLKYFVVMSMSVAVAGLQKTI